MINTKLIPNIDVPRTFFTFGIPSRLLTSGYVTWSSMICGLRPVHSVNTITWFSDRSGIASIGFCRTE